MYNKIGKMLFLSIVILVIGTVVIGCSSSDAEYVFEKVEIASNSGTTSEADAAKAIILTQFESLDSIRVEDGKIICVKGYSTRTIDTSKQTEYSYAKESGKLVITYKTSKVTLKIYCTII